MVSDPFSLYIHIPFCSKKCPYCHFYVVSSKKMDETLFISMLFQEWELKKDQIPTNGPITLYLGGGTPTELSAEGLSQIIRFFKKKYPSIEEITVEANPESTSIELMTQLKNAGCNRVSFGVQSFDEQELISLKRQHNGQKAKQAILAASSAGIQNISIDLMIDIPHQTIESLNRTLSHLKPLPITHLSLYNLVIEEGTPFKRIEPELKRHMPNDTVSLNLLNCVIDHLAILGFERYEISAFSKPGFRSSHNQGYWLSRPFVGLGPSAFSDNGFKRYQNTPHLFDYYAQIEKGIDPISFHETLSQENRFKERFIVRLRLFEPFSLQQFEKVQGFAPINWIKELKRLADLNWIQFDGDWIQLTPKGANFFDEIAVRLV